MRDLCKGRFTRYDFVAYDKLTTGLRHELFRVNQTYNSLNGPKSCRRPVVCYEVVPCKSALTFRFSEEGCITKQMKRERGNLKTLSVTRSNLKYALGLREIGRY